MEQQLNPAWRKSSYSGNGGADCVEAGAAPRAVLVRDTKDRESGTVLRITARDWTRFTASVRG